MAPSSTTRTARSTACSFIRATSERSVGNGVTLKENEHTQTFVTFVDGVATQAAHVGTLFHLTGPDGRVALIAGQQVFEVENGFDTNLISEHGVNLDLTSDAAFCAAFA